MKTKIIKDYEKLSQVKLIDGIIGVMYEKKLSDSSIKAAMPFVKQLSKRFNISEDAAIIFPAFFDRFTDSSIGLGDIAKFYDTTQVKILTYWSAIEELMRQKFIHQFKNSGGDINYFIPDEVIDSIRTNSAYTPKEYKDLTIDQWVAELSTIMDQKDHSRIMYDNFKEIITQLVHQNSHLTIARELATIKDIEDLIIFMRMLSLYIQNHDNHIIKSDLEDLFEHRYEIRSHARRLESGTHTLQKAGLVEYSEGDGQAETDAWKITNVAKARFLVEIDTSTSMNEDKNLKQADSITPKQLFFSPVVSKQIHQLESLLNKERFATVQENLSKHGMRRGFACIFYGAPGTGKTESALQIARITGRALMIVDVPNLRSKWVGDTEKNTKAIFEKYRNYCKQSDLAPILLFNEADAILCKRKEGAENSVDKMENAMQNIILQEMETLDGIMIATTNLTGNLDTAFERRFLYKIEFPKPSPNESQHIWHNMLPEIREQEAYDLAKQYSFSGGQIENIARKQVVNAVLSGEDRVSMESVQEACKTELFNNSNTRRIGFY
jgi:AAA+ superfamily predicted ATPase